jgi:hypothetical protein
VIEMTDKEIDQLVMTLRTRTAASRLTHDETKEMLAVAQQAGFTLVPPSATR